MLDNRRFLFRKEGLEFVKNDKNNYSLSFDMENKNIILHKIIDFSLVKLVYDLNPDIFEKVNMEKINEDEATSALLMKNLFEDLGLPQKYSYLHMRKYVSDNKITVISTPIIDNVPIDIPPDAQQMGTEYIVCDCNIIDNHKINFTFNICINNAYNVPEFAEKLIGAVLFKMFKRVKQFIENINI
jgi:hypothetical protein